MVAVDLKHVAFDEERLVEFIEDDRERFENRNPRTTGRKAFLIFTSFCLGVLLAGYGGGFLDCPHRLLLNCIVRHCGHAVHRHVKHSYVHLIASAQSIELPGVKASIFAAVPKVAVPNGTIVVKRAENASICATGPCLDFAKSIKSNLAPNHKEVDPCTDFSTYVCGGWKANHEYRSDQACKYWPS